MNKNKRGNVPVTIFVLGVILLCGLTIFSFSIGNNQIRKGIGDVSVVEKARLSMEKYNLYIEGFVMDTQKAENLSDVKDLPGYGKSIVFEKGDLKVIYPLS